MVGTTAGVEEIRCPGCGWDVDFPDHGEGCENCASLRKHLGDLDGDKEG